GAGEVEDRARRPAVGGVVAAVVVVVPEAPPFVVAAARRAGRVPDEDVALAGLVGDLELAVAVEVAGRGDGVEPAAGELRERRQVGAARAEGVQQVEAGAADYFAVRGAADVGD